MTDNARILSYSMVSSSLTNPDFFIAMPEFLTLKSKLAALRVDITKPGGCTGCQKKRIESNLFKDYLYIVQALDTNGVKRFKDYFKMDKLMINVQDPKTGAVVFKVV